MVLFIPSSSRSFHSSPSVVLPTHKGWESPALQSTKDWRAEKKAEHSAYQETRALVDFFSCDICGIGMGPGHYEQEVYLYPVYECIMCILDDEDYSETHIFLDCLTVCGTCAGRKRLADLHLVVSSCQWQESYTRLLKEVSTLAQAWRALLWLLWPPTRNGILALYAPRQGQETSGKSRTPGKRTDEKERKTA